MVFAGRDGCSGKRFSKRRLNLTTYESSLLKRNGKSWWPVHVLPCDQPVTMFSYRITLCSPYWDEGDDAVAITATYYIPSAFIRTIALCVKMGWLFISAYFINFNLIFPIEKVFYGNM